MAEGIEPIEKYFMKKEKRIIPEGKTEIAPTELLKSTTSWPPGERPIETLSEAAEVLREADGISTEMFDTLITEADSPEKIQEVIGELNSFLELREAEMAKPLEKARDSLGQETPGTNTFYFLHLRERGREIKTIYKPSSGEKEGPTESQGLRPGIPRGSYFKRDWLTYMVDRAVGMGVVPTTVMRREKGGIGSVQKWIEGAKTLLEDSTRKINEEDEIKIAVLDAITGQQDRHKGNYVVAEDGRGEAIDNGLSFGPSIKTLHRGEVTESLSALETFSGPLERAKEIDPRIHARVIKKVESFTKSTRRQEVLKKAFDFALGKDADEIWQAFLEKVFTISGEKRLPVDYSQVDALSKIKFSLGEEAKGAVEMAEEKAEEERAAA